MSLIDHLLGNPGKGPKIRSPHCSSGQPVANGGVGVTAARWKEVAPAGGSDHVFFNVQSTCYRAGPGETTGTPIVCHTDLFVPCVTALLREATLQGED